MSSETDFYSYLDKKQNMRVLFVCTGNSCRSPTAEALTRKIRPELEVESAGTRAVGHIAENTERKLSDIGAAKYLKPEPDQLSKRALEEADKIVCMMPRHKGYIMRNYEIEKDKLEVWNVKDPINPGVDYEKTFREIRNRVEDLEA